MEKVNTRKFNLTSENPALQGLIDQYNRSGYVYASIARVRVCQQATELTTLAHDIFAMASEAKDQRVLKELARKVSDAIEQITSHFCTTYYNLPKKALVACHVSQKHTEALKEALSVCDKLRNHFSLKKDDSWEPHLFWQTKSKTKDPLLQASQIDSTHFLANQIEIIHAKLPFRLSTVIEAFEWLFGPVSTPIETTPDSIALELRLKQSKAFQKDRQAELLKTEKRMEQVQRARALYGTGTSKTCHAAADRWHSRPLQPQLRYHFVGPHRQAYWG